MRIVFMGTPDFAAASLRALLDAGHDIAAVFTQPDKPCGRGMKPAFSPVKELALQNAVPVYQPVKLRDGEALRLIESLKPDVLVVVAYGRILPEDILAVPRLGAINVHGSLLPAYRGAAPIQWAVLNGDRTTGVTTMYMDAGMDTGDMIFAEETPIGEFETAGELFDRLAAMGAALLVRTLEAVADGAAPRIPQDHSRATYVKQLDKSICPITWNEPARAVVKHIYGLQPWPVATMELGGETLRVFGAGYGDGRTHKTPGTIVSAGKQGIEVACTNGETVVVTELQAQGKKRMKASDWLLGHPLEVR